MRSKTTKQFRKLFAELPYDIRERSRRAYRLFISDPNYPSLHFKRVSTRMPVYSARITDNYRVLGVLKEETIIWFWIGKHADYDKMLTQL